MISWFIEIRGHGGTRGGHGGDTGTPPPHVSVANATESLKATLEDILRRSVAIATESSIDHAPP